MSPLPEWLLPGVSLIPGLFVFAAASRLLLLTRQFVRDRAHARFVAAVLQRRDEDAVRLLARELDLKPNSVSPRLSNEVVEVLSVQEQEAAHIATVPEKHGDVEETDVV